MLAINLEQSRQNEGTQWYQPDAATRENQQSAQEQLYADHLLAQPYASDDDAKNQRVNFNPHVSQDMQLLTSSDEQAQGQASAQHRLNYQSILKKLKKQLLQHQSNNITSNNMTIAFFGGGEEGSNEVETQNIEEYKKN